MDEKTGFRDTERMYPKHSRTSDPDLFDLSRLVCPSCLLLTVDIAYPNALFLCAWLELSHHRYHQPAFLSPNLTFRCGHCKQFAPEYEKIASTLKENDPPIPVAKIDATSESALASRFDVSGYPTIKILKKGQAVDYEGSRTQEGERCLSCWKELGPGLTPLGREFG